MTQLGHRIPGYDEPAIQRIASLPDQDLEKRGHLPIRGDHPPERLDHPDVGACLPVRPRAEGLGPDFEGACEEGLAAVEVAIGAMISPRRAQAGKLEDRNRGPGRLD